MHFGLSDEQQGLVDTVAALLARQTDPDQAWRLLVEQVGAPALAIPEEHDGAGATLFETSLVLAEVGAALLPNPLLGTSLATQALLLAGHTDPLPELAAGRSATLVFDRAGPALDGSADLVLLVEDDELSEVTACARHELVGVDQTLDFAEVRVTETRALGAVSGATLLQVGAALVTALQVGAMRQALQMTIDYTKQREQFGRAIGSYQALKHRMADCFVALETSRSASWAACFSAARLDDDLPARAAVAKSWCGDALRLIASEMVQLHGGIAITWEHPAHTYFKRADALDQLFGQPHQHRVALEALQ